VRRFCVNLGRALIRLPQSLVRIVNDYLTQQDSIT
jgi:hypothetical protein